MYIHILVVTGQKIPHHQREELKLQIYNERRLSALKRGELIQLIRNHFGLAKCIQHDIHII